jgi:hypothetical protein
MRIGKAQPLARQPVAIRRLNFGRTISAQVTIPEIVGKNDHDVGLGRHEGCRLCRIAALHGNSKHCGRKAFNKAFDAWS